MHKKTNSQIFGSTQKGIWIKIGVKKMDKKIVEKLLLAERNFNRLVPANNENLKLLEDMGYPRILIEFYKRYEPDKSFNYGNVTLYDAKSIKEENSKYVPAVYIFPLGFLAFAANKYGDLYCFKRITPTDTEPHVFLVSHDEIHDEVSSCAEIFKKSKKVARGFEDFFQKLVNGSLLIEYYDN
jgi:hypothetical protein